jgi:hypothetical protein
MHISQLTVIVLKKYYPMKISVSKIPKKLFRNIFPSLPKLLLDSRQGRIFHLAK